MIIIKVRHRGSCDFKHGRTRSIATCSKPRFARNQEMPNCPTDGVVCPPKKYRNK